MNRIEAVIGGMKMIRKLTWPEAKAQGEREAKKTIRKAIAKPLRELRKEIALIGWSFGAADRASKAIRAIDAATKPPKRKAAK